MSKEGVIIFFFYQIENIKHELSVQNSETKLSINNDDWYKSSIDINQSM